MIAAVVVPIIANGIRAYSIVMIGHFSGMELAVGVDHLLWGWVFFGIVMFALFSVGSIWRDEGALQHALAAEPVAAHTGHGRSLRAVAVTGGAVLLVASWTALAYFVKSIQPPPYSQQIQLPEHIGSWHFTPETYWAWHPAYRGEDRMVQGTYLFDGYRIGVTLQQYMRQEQGAEVVPSGAFISRELRGSWRVIGQSREHISPDGRDIDATRFVLEGPGAERLIVFYWYWVAGSHVSNPYVVKALETLSLLTLELPRSARIYVVYEEGLGEKESTEAQTFIGEAIGPIEAALETLQ
jgi:EpsI family protein